ncbi:hypothetical protein chiPu_0008581 [Chiloscyllium punctatum]|uniref:Uncharacterized protein n=1 Tax=Chiloscyllium punctatum TaxID=137246 RepID=A0A401SIB8_CHIPU|nr:hypothetical protein [Chiloscyllium punctatum]
MAGRPDKRYGVHRICSQGLATRGGVRDPLSIFFSGGGGKEGKPAARRDPPPSASPLGNLKEIPGHVSRFPTPLRCLLVRPGVRHPGGGCQSRHACLFWKGGVEWCKSLQQWTRVEAEQEGVMQRWQGKDMVNDTSCVVDFSIQN